MELQVGCRTNSNKYDQVRGALFHTSAHSLQHSSMNARPCQGPYAMPKRGYSFCNPHQVQPGTAKIYPRKFAVVEESPCSRNNVQLLSPPTCCRNVYPG